MILTSCYPQPIQHPTSSQTFCDCAVLFEDTFFLLELSKVETRRDTGEEVKKSLTAMAFTVDSIAKIIEAHRTSNGLELRAVHVVTSIDEDGADIWTVDRLAAIWATEEPSETGKNVPMYEALSGYTYGLTHVGSQSDALSRRKLCMRFPVD